MKLIKQEYVDKGLPRGWQPYYIYQIVVNNEVVGKVVLREGTLEERYYDGHVGIVLINNIEGIIMLIKQ